ncbi:uncharacterized protein [Montipora foliosa]|uniref:uncharacterized protein isoform X1 n=1 Tax=Montipora foliosa TaxID=591990 RepID=UPI0035F10F50
MPRAFVAHFVVVGCFFLITRIYAVTCPKGEFITKSGNCQPCPNGTYSDRINSTRCYQCDICRGRHNIPTKPCSSTTNSICSCKPGHYFQDSVLYCSKCRTCGIGRGVKKNCTRNSNTVCAPCGKGTYSDSKDLSRCKPCTKCKKGDTVKEECTKKRNTVCHSGKQNNLSKGTPLATPFPPPPQTTATPVTVLSTARSKPSKQARPAQSTKRNNDVLPFEVSLSVLSSFLFCVLVAFGCLMYRYRKRGSHNLAHQEVAAEASTGSTNVTPENHYTTVPVTGGRRGRRETGPTSRPRCNHDFSRLPGQDEGTLPERCLFYLSKGLVMSSRHVYQTAQRRFLTFCKQDLKTAPNTFPLPADEQTLMRFCTMLSERMNYSLIKTYLSAVRALHLDNGLPDPLLNCVQLQNLIRGVKQVKSSSGPTRFLITFEIMRTIHESLDLSDQDNIMIWAACCLGYFGFLRLSEFMVDSAFNPGIHLSVSDIHPDSDVNPTHMKVNVKCLRTDPFRKQCHIYMGRIDSPMCPYVAMDNYLKARGLASGPMFLYRDGSPLSRQKLSCTLQSILRSAGSPPCKYSGFSFRSGAATTAASRGVSDDLIKTLCRRCIDSYDAYDKTSIDTVLRVTSQLV